RWAEQYRRRLYGRRRLALTTCLQAELRLGRHVQVLPELEDLAHADPVDEAVAALLMSAYYRAGRQAEAMHTFARTRARLREDLGADPGKDLTRLHERILTHDPDLYSSPARAVAVVAVADDRPATVLLPDRAPALALVADRPGTELTTRFPSPPRSFPEPDAETEPAPSDPAEPTLAQDLGEAPSDAAADLLRTPPPRAEAARHQVTGSGTTVRHYGGDHMEFHGNVFHGPVTFAGKSTSRRPASDGDDRA
ncbi:AfsR/SARP family transcriptional regulator, partial [Streptosporangium sp. NPDC051022]|uniref:AfsR/SARP family transcriptional regulator n=1 Tax=Streptosporangium sp. NPDC051022 TaxID=3155752 RepID=UPI003438ED6E